MSVGDKAIVIIHTETIKVSAERCVFQSLFSIMFSSVGHLNILFTIDSGVLTTVGAEAELQHTVQ